MSQRFEGKIAVVTGAAGGIGRAAVVALAAGGARVVATDLKDTPIEETALLRTWRASTPSSD